MNLKTHLKVLLTMEILSITATVTFKEECNLERFYNELQINEKITSLQLIKNKINPEKNHVDMVYDHHLIRIYVNYAQVIYKSLNILNEIFSSLNITIKEINEIFVSSSYSIDALNVDIIRHFSTLPNFHIEQLSDICKLKHNKCKFKIINGKVNQMSPNLKEAQESYLAFIKEL